MVHNFRRAAGERLRAGRGGSWLVDFPYWERVLWAVFTFALVVAWQFAAPGDIVGRGTERPTGWSMLLATVLIIFCVRVYLGHGRQSVTPLGIWAIMIATLGGYSGFVGLDDERVSSTALAFALLLMLIQTVGIAIIAWGNNEHAIQLRPWSTGRGMIIVLAWIVIAGATVVSRVGAAGFAEGAGFTAILLLAFAAWAPKDARLLSGGTAGVFVACAVYLLALHTGQGRLRLVALAACLLIIFSLCFTQWTTKFGSALGFPLILFGMALYRLAFIRETDGQAEGRTGLESLTDPIITFSHVIDRVRFGIFDFKGYSNLFTPFTPLLPDNWNIPEAWGFALVTVWNTERYGSGYSAAGTATGEWYWMGGVVGVLISIPVLGLGLKLLNWIIESLAGSFMKSLLSTLVLAAAIILAGALGDMAWGGVHVFVYRSVFRILVCIAVVGFFWLWSAAVVKQRFGVDRWRC